MTDLSQNSAALASAGVVDAHCHLDDFWEEGPAALDAVVQRAKAAGVAHLVVNGLWQGRPGDFGCAASLARRDPSFFSASAAISPHDAAKACAGDFQRASELARSPFVCAIGETGLEYHYDVGPHDVQMEAFRWHIRLALEVNKPLILHIRDAHADALRIFREEGAVGHPVQVHCFSGTPDEARAWLDLGAHLSFSGMLTFRKNDDLREAARLAPSDRLFVETDSPYLAPVPHRGKVCEPAFVIETLKVLASVRGMRLEDAARATSMNAAAFFGFALPAKGDAL